MQFHDFPSFSAYGIVLHVCIRLDSMAEGRYTYHKSAIIHFAPRGGIALSPLSPPFPLPLDAQEITQRRARLMHSLQAAYESLCACPIREIPPDLFRALPRAYDQLFLRGTLFDLLPDLQVVPSPRMTSCGGKFVATFTGTRRTLCQIRMATDFLFRLEHGPFSLNGLTAHSALEAFSIVFEHELCHALDLALTGSLHGHGDVFRALSGGLFGHTACRHSLPTRAVQAAANGVGRGAKVSFVANGRTLRGIVTRVGKTATVMVPYARGAYCDVRGKRYTKYLVSPALLTPLE